MQIKNQKSKITLLLALLLASLAAAEVNSEVDGITYTGDGTTKTFTFPFGILSTSELRVVVRTVATGAESVLALNSDYSMTDDDGDGDYTDGPGGSITTLATAAVSSAYQIWITRKPALTQTRDLDDTIFLRLGRLEDALDETAYQVQYLRRLLWRVPLIPETEAQVVDMNVPNAISRANGTLTFDANGTPEVIAGTLDPNNITVSALWQIILAQLDRSASLTALGLGQFWLDRQADANSLEFRTGASVQRQREIDVRDYGADGTAGTNQYAPLQAALDALDPNDGGTVYIPGGLYPVETGLHCYGDSNMVIAGAGIDQTVIVGTVGDMNIPTGLPGESWGVLSIDAAAGYAAPVKNIVIRDLTIQLVGGTPGTFGADVADGTYYIKVLQFGYCQNITLERVKIKGGRWESCYADGGVSSSPSQIMVRNCQFQDCQHNALNFNTYYATDVSVSGCHFDSCAYGVQLIQKRVTITDNIFTRIKWCAINFNEANYSGPATHYIAGTVIANNVIDQLGYASGGVTTSTGIRVGNGASAYTDGSEDLGLTIANNTISSSVALGQAVEGISLAGSGKVIGNHVAEIRGVATGGRTAYTLSSGALDGTDPNRTTIFFEHNSLDRTFDPNTWSIGVRVAAGDCNDMKVYLSGNRILQGSNYALLVNNTATQPFVSLDGDILNGYLYDYTKWSAPAVGVLNYSGAWNDVPLYGNTNAWPSPLPVHDAASSIFYVTKTIIKTIDLDDDASTDDYQFDDDAANATEQVKTLTNILPAFAELTGWQIRCLEGVADANTATVQFGTSSGGTELANEATACDDTDEIIGTAAGAGPILAATGTARSLYFSVTPSANWSAMHSTGRWAVLITYVDYGAALTQRNP
jgi:hypothetical protein